jgi:hypothetical protein
LQTLFQPVHAPASFLQPVLAAARTVQSSLSLETKLVPNSSKLLTTSSPATAMDTIHQPHGYKARPESTISQAPVIPPTTPTFIDMYLRRLENNFDRSRKRGCKHDRETLRRVFRKTRTFYQRDVLETIAFQTAYHPEHIQTPQLHYPTFEEVLVELRRLGIEVDSYSVEDVLPAGEEAAEVDKPRMSSKLDQEVRVFPIADESVTSKVEDFYDSEEKHFHDEMKRRHSLG